MIIELKDVDEREMISFLEGIVKETLCYEDDLEDFNGLLDDFSLPFYLFHDGDEKEIGVCKKY